MHPHVTPTLPVQENIEEWRDVPGYEGYYQVSSFGRVRSMKRADSIGRPRSSRFLRPATRDGYLMVVLCKHKEKRAWLVHGLVALAFIGERPDGYQINHIDCTKDNNHIENLEYVTPGDNIRHAVRHGRMGRFTIEQVWEIRETCTDLGYQGVLQMARKLNVGRDVIFDVLSMWLCAAIPNRDGSPAQVIRAYRGLRGINVCVLLNEGYSMEEIAEKYGVTEGAVQRSYYRAIAKG